MKKIFTIIILLVLSFSCYSQWISNGNNITTDKNIGIGTINPQQKLDVDGNISTQNIILKDGYRLTPFIDQNIVYDGKTMGLYSIQWANDSWHKGAQTLYMNGYGGIKLFTRGSSRISIQKEGNVGIGTDTPQQKLDVDGNISTQNIILKDGYRLTPFIDQNIVYDGKTMGLYSIQWANDSWHKGAQTLYMNGYGGIKLFTGGTPKLTITKEGSTYIAKNLEVEGTIRTTEVKIESVPWADFVFDKDYKLPSLQEVENHINKHKHLPDIPSEKEVQENGVSLGEMQAKLLQKIEELTLYIITQDKKIHKMERELKESKRSNSIENNFK